MSPIKIIRFKDILQYAGVAASTFEEQVKRGEAPAPVPLNDTGTAKGFLESEIVEWQQFLIDKRDGTAAHATWREHYEAKKAARKAGNAHQPVNHGS